MADEWPTVLSKWIALVRRRIAEAGAPSEQSYPRNGGFSHHAETHSFAVGFGVGMAASSGFLGDEAKAFVGSVVATAFGLNRGPQLTSPRITEDIVEEPHYAIAGLGVGLLFGFTPGEVVEQMWSALPV